ncbi:MAG: PfkB family carbohydrate kinase, partial [Gammaproteobacteria bacterium]|nr:PfkB family carbohydrate kinase [Gammaproteobacteria bacterium]
MLPLSELLDLVERLNEASVTCIGDLMLDRFIYGEVERVSPEAPVPVLRVASESDMLGGAGNVARNLAALNVRSALAAVVGDDEAGHRTESLVRELPHCRASLIVEPGRGTTIKTRCIGGNQQILRVDREQRDAITQETAEALLANIKENLAATRACILSDYGKGVLTAELTRAVIELAHRNGCRVVIDPKGVDYERYRGADVITPNREELATATGMPARQEADLIRAAQHVRERYAIGAVVVTRSEEGLTVVEADEVHHLPAETHEVYDVSGAG